MGVTLASFHAVGNVPLAIQMFTSLASDGAIAGAAIFNMRAPTPSTRVELPDGIASISLLVWFGVIFGKACLTSEVLRLLMKDFKVVGLNRAAVLSTRLSAKPVRCLLNTSAVEASSWIRVALFSSK